MFRESLDFPIDHSELSSSEMNDPTRLLYWENNLKDLNTIYLQADFIINNKLTNIIQSIFFTLPKHLITKLSSQFPHYNTEQILLTHFYALLYRYSNQTDICLGVATASHSPLENSSYLPLRLQFDSEIHISELLNLLNKTINTHFINQLPLESIQKIIQINSEEITSSPFNIYFNTHSQKLDKKNSFLAEKNNNNF